jgi:hypothetical protein
MIPGWIRICATDPRGKNMVKTTIATEKATEHRKKPFGAAVST